MTNGIVRSQSRALLNILSCLSINCRAWLIVHLVVVCDTNIICAIVFTLSMPSTTGRSLYLRTNDRLWLGGRLLHASLCLGGGGAYCRTAGQ